jgi:hypothetical protein
MSICDHRITTGGTRLRGEGEPDHGPPHAITQRKSNAGRPHKVTGWSEHSSPLWRGTPAQKDAMVPAPPESPLRREESQLDLKREGSTRLGKHRLLYGWR